MHSRLKFPDVRRACKAGCVSQVVLLYRTVRSDTSSQRVPSSLWPSHHTWPFLNW